MLDTNKQKTVLLCCCVVVVVVWCTLKVETGHDDLGKTTNRPSPPLFLIMKRQTLIWPTSAWPQSTTGPTFKETHTHTH